MTFSFFAAKAGRVHLCGHRGQCIAAPENTMAAFRAAHALGASSCETDAVLTADQQIVLLHDLTVDRTSDGSGVVADMTLGQLAEFDAGSWFAPEFAAERIPTLRQAIELAHELDLGFEVEVKEKRDFDGFVAALSKELSRPEDRERVMLISFDHVSLKMLKTAIPGVRTGGIAHERYGDPLAVVRSADLDELCIDLSVFNPKDAERLHRAGHSIRCHAFKPAVMDQAARAGLDWHEVLATSLRAGLIDSLSGDDVGWLRDFRDAALQ